MQPALGAKLASSEEPDGSLLPSGAKMRNDPKCILCRRNFKDVISTPNPYLTLRAKVIDDASSKYLVGHEISPILNLK